MNNNSSSSKNLKEIFDKHQCDRGSIKHRYDIVYEKELNMYHKVPSVKMIEVGVFKGAGICSWLDYFPSNLKKIIGIDIFTRTDPHELGIYSPDDSEKIRLIKEDSTTIDLSVHLSKNRREKFDIIIDDGMHSPESNARTFTNLVPYLKKSGVYFIEDVWPLDIMTTKERKHYWVERHKHLYKDEKWDFFMKSLDGYNVERFDLRETSGHPDSYLFKVTLQ